MNYTLFKGSEAVGDAVVMSSENVVYHLYSSIRITRYGTEDELRRKYKLVLK